MKKNGRYFEESLLGVCPWRSKIYHELWPGIREVMKYNIKPRPKINELLILISKIIGIENTQLKFNTAVRSPLDHFHGIDAIISWGNERIITIDTTTNPAKKEAKADFIVRPEHIEDLDDLAFEISQKFLTM